MSSASSSPYLGVTETVRLDDGEPPEEGHLVSERRSVLIASAAFTLLSVGYLAIAATYPVGTLAQPGAGLFPMVIGALLLISSAGLIVESVRMDPSAGITWPYMTYIWRMLLVLAASTAYLLLLPVLGQVLAGLVLCLGLFASMRFRPWWLAVLLSIIFSVGVQVLFAVVLKVPLPRGPFGLWGIL